MKALILGAGGFIGSSLTEKIAANEANSVIAFRRAADGTNVKNNIAIITGDFCRLKDHYDLLEDADVIIHTISSLLPVSDSFSDETENVITPTTHLLDHFKNSNKHFIFISSGGAVYELNPGKKLNETMPRKAYNFYGLSKIMLEDVFLFYQEQYKVNVTVLRPSNIFGYRNDNIGRNGIISTLISNCAAGKPTDVWGTGEAVRDYIYIGDFTEAVYKITEKKLTGVYNVGSNNVRSINEIIEIINRYTPENCIINYKENLYHLPEYIIPDNEKIRNALPLDAPSCFEQKIKELVTKYYERHKQTSSL